MENSEPITLDNICLDFESRQQRFHKPLQEFVNEERSQLGLEDSRDPANTFIQQIWPDNLPGSLIVSHASFDNFDRYSFRPPAEGPKSSSFGANGLTAGFTAYRSRGKLVVDSFFKVCHIKPRAFERYVSGIIHSKPNGQRMEVADFSKLAQIPRNRLKTAGQLQKWLDCLAWQKKLIFLRQSWYRYYGFKAEGNSVFFLIRKNENSTESSDMFMAASLADSQSTSNWKQSSKRPRFTKLGKIEKISALKKKVSEQFQIPDDIDKNKLAVARIKLDTNNSRSRTLTDALPSEGFLVSSVAGDLKPVTSAEKNIKRFMNGGGENCYLADFIFDIKNSAVRDEIFEFNNNGDSEFNQAQLEAVKTIRSSADISLLLGPPGTGKTTVIKAVCKKQIRQGKRVLIASQTNVAVDNVLKGLSDHPAIRPLRIGLSKRVQPDGQDFLEDNALKTWLKAVRRLCHKRIETNKELTEKITSAKEAVEILSSLAEKNDKLKAEINELEKQLSSLEAGKNRHLRSYKSCIKELKSCRDELEDIDDFIRWLQAPLGSKPRFNLPDNLGIETVIYKAVGEINRQLKEWELGYLKDDPENILYNFYLANRAVKAAGKLKSILSEISSLCEKTDHNKIDNWSRQLLEARKLLDVIFAGNLPAAIEDFTSSLKPDLRWQELIDNLSGLCEILSAGGGEYIYAAACKMSLILKQQKRKLEEKLQDIQRKNSDSKRKLDEISYQIEQSQEQLRANKDKLKALQKRWTESWPNACLDTDRKTPPDISSQQLQSRSETLQAYLDESSDKRRSQSKWDSIRADWQKIINQPAGFNDPQAKRLYIKHANVVGLTCLQAGQPSFHQGDDFRAFDTVFIDEVSKATPPELLMPMMCAGKIALIGDYRQLPPMFRENESSFTESLEDGTLKPQDFEKYRQLVTSSFFERLFFDAPDNIKNYLKQQYRSHSQIQATFNPFYNGRLQAGGGPDKLDSRKQHHLSIKDKTGGWFLQPGQHTLWIDSSFDQRGKPVFEKQIKSSKVNLLEVELTVGCLGLLNKGLKARGYGPVRRFEVKVDKKQSLGQFIEDKMAKACPETVKDIFDRRKVEVNGHTESRDYIPKKKDIVRIDARMPVGVITFYGAQLGHLKRKLSGKNNKFAAVDIRANTVDKFQGMQMPIVITSLVRANRHRHASEFVREYRRINVALSRAQNLLMVIGSELFFRNTQIALPDIATGQVTKQPVYKKIYDTITRFGGRRYAKQILK